FPGLMAIPLDFISGHPARGPIRPFTNKNPDSNVKMHKLSGHSQSGLTVGLLNGCQQINLPMQDLTCHYRLYYSF
ncbi:hypothetical protein, partial [uncultured Gimesia sp.]|uniref:hypothetical protein n=1 Tax=uncultured Gimesia sp. TaxID=1678688 RepID=UPI0026172640